jgi:hypothetical protein
MICQKLEAFTHDFGNNNVTNIYGNAFKLEITCIDIFEPIADLVLLF